MDTMTWGGNDRRACKYYANCCCRFNGICRRSMPGGPERAGQYEFRFIMARYGWARPIRAAALDHAACDCNAAAGARGSFRLLFAVPEFAWPPDQLRGRQGDRVHTNREHRALHRHSTLRNAALADR